MQFADSSWWSFKLPLPQSKKQRWVSRSSRELVLYIKLFSTNFETDCIQSVTCRKRQRLSVFRHYLKTHTCYNHITFKFYRNKWNHLLQLSKTNCENEQFMINKAKTKEIWKGIKQLVGQKTEGSTLPGILTINEQEITKSMIKPLLINWSRARD